MTSLHHHHQQHHQELNKTMEQHQATHQSGGMLLERRIIQLLTETNLTFKEIVMKLEGEQLPASIGMIRRINRDNRYRRPRYDSKLTPTQRDSLVEELRDHKGMKPNLSLLAKRYGVCHGSVWYWWDKLNRIKRCDQFTRRTSASGLAKSGVTGGNLVNCTTGATALLANGVAGGSRLRVGKTELQFFTADERVSRRRSLKGVVSGGPNGGQLLAAVSSASSSSSSSSSSSMSPGLSLACQQQRWRNYNNILLDERFDYVGRVSIVGRNGVGSSAAPAATGAAELGCPIDLPILMFARKELAEADSVKTSASSGSLGLSPSPVVVVDDSLEEDEGVDEGEAELELDSDQSDDDDDMGTEFSDSRDASSASSHEMLIMDSPEQQVSGGAKLP